MKKTVLKIKAVTLGIALLASEFAVLPVATAYGEEVVISANTISDNDVMDQGNMQGEPEKIEDAQTKEAQTEDVEEVFTEQDELDVDEAYDFEEALLGESTSKSCSVYTGTNVGAQDYNTYASVIASYLVPLSDGGVLKVQCYQNSEGADKLVVETYDKSLNLIQSKNIALGLTYFGGFYATQDAYYVLTGQDNEAENNSKEVFRVTKYDKNFTKKANASLYGANTYVPFSAGSARFTSLGKYLLIHTCHTMYASSDGLHHQACVTMEIDTESMEVTDSYTKVMNYQYGYVSHSFNQFIQMDGTNLVTVDHGDAYPRAIVLLKYPKDASTGSYVPDYYNPCERYDVVGIDGSIGANYTGVSIGGFEITNTSYLATYNKDVSESGKARNIYLSIINKSTGEASYKKITSYKASEASATTPSLVKVSENLYLIMWTRGADVVYYQAIDASGKLVGETMALRGEMSDCQPVVWNGSVLWYTWEGQTTTFYKIDATTRKAQNKVEVSTGHSFVYKEPNMSNKTVERTCSKCGKSETKNITTRMLFYWATSDAYYSTAAYQSSMKAGSTQKLMYNISGDASSNVDTELEIQYSDKSVAKLQLSGDAGELTALKAGTTTISIWPKSNPSLMQQYTLTVTGTASTGNSEIKVQETTNVKEDGSNADSTSNAETVKKNGITYKIVKKDNTKTLTVTKVTNKNATSIKIPASVKTGGQTLKVTAINKKAFSGMKKLKSVTIGSNVTNIGTKAFYGCSSLKSIKITSKKLTKVGSSAFKKIKKKATITVPASKLSKYKSLLKNKSDSGVKIRK